MRLPVRLVGNKALKFRLTFQILLSSNGLTSHAGVFREARIFGEGRNTKTKISPVRVASGANRFVCLSTVGRCLPAPGLF